jgi:hypothetical protein
VDQTRFKIVTRSLTSLPSRRNVLRSLASAGLGLSALQLPEGGKGKGKKGKKGKVTLCHQGQTLTVANAAVKGHKKHGDTAGPCPSGPAGPTPQGPVLTDQCLGPKAGAVGGGGTARYAQTFTAERSGSLRQIQFSVNKPPATTGDYLVQLLRVSGGKPSHSPTDVLATLTVPDAAVATSSDAMLTATFAGPALVAGTEYAVTFGRPGTVPAGANPNIVKSDASACRGKLFLALVGDVFEEVLATDGLVYVLVS